MKWVWNPKEKRYQEEEQDPEDQQLIQVEEDEKLVKPVIEKYVPINFKKLQNNKNEANHSKPEVIDVQKFQFKINLKDYVKQEESFATSQMNKNKIRSESI